MSWERSVFIGCTHGDLLDHGAAQVVKEFVADWKPHYRVHLGDLWDFRALRKKAEPEERAQGISYDFNCGLDLLDWFQPQYLTLGNHDHRAWRAAEETSNGVLADLCAKFCQDAEDALRKRKIRWIPWGVNQYLKLPMGGPKLIHGYRSTLYPAKAHFEHWGECITAHVHRPDSHQARHIDGGKAICVGTLADLGKLSYADGNAAKLGWRQSFAWGLHNTKTGEWQAWQAINNNGTWISPQGVLAQP